MIWWYDVIWCVLRSPLRPLARPCIFDASISCSQNPISPEDVIERTGFSINPHMYIHVQHCRHCFPMKSVWLDPDMLKWQRLGIQAWSPAQTCYLAPGSKDSTEHVQYQLLGRWKELQTHVLLLAIAPTRTTSTQTLLHSWQEDNVGPPWARNHFTSWTDTTGIAGLRYRTFETCWYEVP